MTVFEDDLMVCWVVRDVEATSYIQHHCKNKLVLVVSDPVAMFND